MMGGGVAEESKQNWTLHDMIIPAGKTAKLIRIKNPHDPDFRISEIADKIKFVNAAPVIILAGAMTQRA
jgi:3-polyprenyl-4-hydroxybenzoate decarboxylase